jgi:hypothetical protein
MRSNRIGIGPAQPGDNTTEASVADVFKNAEIVHAYFLST